MRERKEKSADSLRKRGGAGARQGCVNPLPLTGHSQAPLMAMQVVHALIRRCAMSVSSRARTAPRGMKDAVRGDLWFKHNPL